MLAGEVRSRPKGRPEDRRRPKRRRFYRLAGKLLPAEALLQKILDGKLQSKDSDVASARRRFAIILATAATIQTSRRPRP